MADNGNAQLRVGNSVAQNSPGTNEANLAEQQIQRNPRSYLDAIPEGSTCLTDLEAEQILMDIGRRTRLILTDAPDLYRLPESFYDCLEYAMHAAASYAKLETVMKIMEPLKKHGLSDNEICMIVNLRPKSVDRASARLPFLEPKMSVIREALKIALEELAIVSQSL